jgi:hypothetical protein
LESLLARLKTIEQELQAEIQKKQKEFGYEIRNRKVHFTAVVTARHKLLATKLSIYLRRSKLFSILTAPVIWFCVFPVFFMHIVAKAYQAICFPIYGIPKVCQADYIVMDRRKLSYLNSMEKFNCFYCGYVNGLLAYVQEIAARTEQFWCPIKHAVRLKTIHSRYQKFLDYGDGEHYHERLEEVRRAFEDLKNTPDK